jgi:putative hydrolase of the HAD superfamily
MNENFSSETSRATPIENVLFDIGNVLIRWDVDAILRRFTDDPAMQNTLRDQVFYRADWNRLDEGSLTDAQAITRMAERAGCEIALLESLFHHFRRLMPPIVETLSLMEDVKRAGLGLYILSNMSEATFASLSQRYEFFSRFDGVMISAKEKMAKPDRAFFEHCLQRFGLSPAVTLFIDDAAANIETAQSLGLSAIVFENTPACFAQIQSRLNLPAGR